MSNRNPNWTEDQLILALALYFRTPYSRITKRNPEMAKLGELIGRSAGSVSCKLANFASFDSEVEKKSRKGLGNAGKLDQVIWERYVDNPATFSIEKLVNDALRISEKYEAARQTLFPVTPDQEIMDLPVGTMRERLVLERVHQNAFRQAVLRRYDERCVVTGLQCPSLLEAAHIIPWSEDSSLRMVPSNGLSLNPLIHKAYDINLLGIDPDGFVHVHELLLRRQEEQFEPTRHLFETLNGSRISCPERAQPMKAALDARYQKYLKAEIPPEEVALFSKRHRNAAP